THTHSLTLFLTHTRCLSLFLIYRQTHTHSLSLSLFSHKHTKTLISNGRLSRSRPLPWRALYYPTLSFLSLPFPLSSPYLPSPLFLCPLLFSLLPSFSHLSFSLSIFISLSLSLSSIS